MTSPIRRTLILGLAMLGVTFAAAQPAGALTVGIGDNTPAMFNDGRYQGLQTKVARKILPYDWYHWKSQRDNLDAWLAGAAANGVEPLIAFNHSNRSPRKLPTVGTYQKALRYLLRTHPEVRSVSPWNEANHSSQPTWRNPRRAAEYYNTTRKICRGCNIVAADVLDQANMIPWIREFRRYAHRPSLWGLHSYADANRNVPWRRSALKQLLANVNGKVWLTEVGGLVAFKNSFRYSERRGANGTRNTLRLAHRSSRVKRVYFYSWYGTRHARKRTPYRWDSGLVSWEGVARPGYFTLKRWLEEHPGDR